MCKRGSYLGERKKHDRIGLLSRSVPARKWTLEICIEGGHLVPLGSPAGGLGQAQMTDQSHAAVPAQAILITDVAEGGMLPAGVPARRAHYFSEIRTNWHTLAAASLGMA